MVVSMLAFCTVLFVGTVADTEHCDPLRVVVVRKPELLAESIEMRSCFFTPQT